MRRKISALLVVVMTIGLIGCGSSETDELMKEKKETLVSMYRELENEYNILKSEYATLELKMEELYADNELNPGITSLGDGSGDMTLNSVNGRVQFNQPLQYPGSNTVTANGHIDIIDNVTVDAKDTWATRIRNSTLELQHESGISGSINISTVDTYISDGTIRDMILTPWMQQFNAQAVEYGNIFISGDIWGSQGKSEVLVDGESGRIQCGAFVYGQIAVTYVFVYNGAQDSVKDEVIKNVLNTLTVYGQVITVE